MEDGVLMGFRDPSGIDLENEKNPIWPSSTAYFDKLYGPRHWSPPATTLNFSIGQGENTQTLINMMRFYQGLASDGHSSTPYIVRPTSSQTVDLGLSPAQLDGLRESLIAVVEQGTAAASRRKDLAVAGKTGTAQNSHGKDHGWFIGFAPADKPELIIGAIMEFAEHGSSVAPYVIKTLRRQLLGPDTVGTIKIKVLIDEAVPQDTAPRPVELNPDSAAARALEDSIRRAAASRRSRTRPLSRRSCRERPDHRSPALPGERRPHTLRPADPLFGGSDRRPDSGGRRVASPVRVGGNRRGGRGVVFHDLLGCSSGSRRRSTGSACPSWSWCCWWGPARAPRQSSSSWLSIGGHQIGQPSELAKVATVLMLARYLSSRREPPRSLRDLLVPGLIVGMPFLLVLKQPDLGSAIVFVGIAFAMLFWAGVRPRLLFLLASPGLSLLLAFNDWTWGAWMVLFTALLFVWRPYISDALVVWLLNVAMGAIALPLWKRLAPYQQNRLLTFLNPEVDPRAAGYHAIQSRVAIGSGGWFGNGYTEGPQKRLAFLPEQHTDFVFPSSAKSWASSASRSRWCCSWRCS